MKDYKKYFRISATPDDIYGALTNPISLQLMTGEKAIMSTVPQSEFSLWDGSIVGKNLEFEEGKKIVQHWYFGDASIPSIVTIKLHPDKGATSLELKHTNITDDDYDAIVEGWNHAYMAALIEFFED